MPVICSELGLPDFRSRFRDISCACRNAVMAPELLYSLLASTTMLGCWVGFRVGVLLGSAGGAAGTESLHCMCRTPCTLLAWRYALP